MISDCGPPLNEPPSNVIPGQICTSLKKQIAGLATNYDGVSVTMAPAFIAAACRIFNTLSISYFVPSSQVIKAREKRKAAGCH